MFENEKFHNTEVRRPLSCSLIDDGVYKGRILSTDFREMDSKFHASGKRQVFSMKIEVENEDGEIVYLLYSVNYSWSLKGNFVKLLSDFAMLPDEGECLDVTEFIGLEVTVTVMNNEKDGKKYSNIVALVRNQI